LGEVSKQPMSGLEKVKLWVAVFPFCEPLEKFLSVPGDKLGCEFDDIHVNHGK